MNQHLHFPHINMSSPHSGEESWAPPIKGRGNEEFVDIFFHTAIFKKQNTDFGGGSILSLKFRIAGSKQVDNEKQPLFQSFLLCSFILHRQCSPCCPHVGQNTLTPRPPPPRPWIPQNRKKTSM